MLQNRDHGTRQVDRSALIINSLHLATGLLIGYMRRIVYTGTLMWLWLIDVKKLIHPLYLIFPGTNF